MSTGPAARRSHIGIIAELKRRNVFRVTAAYMVVSWVLIQLTALAVPALMLPVWANSFVFFLLAAGLPIAMLAAWAFEMTPEGIRRTKEADAPSERRVRIGDYVMLVAVLAIAGSLIYSVFLTRHSDGTNARLEGSAIAVLPFENLSVEAEEVMFSQALTSDIRSQLAAVPGLQVASRAASIQYAEGANVREIGRQLNVSAVLEGSVQKVGNRLRVTAQLVDVDEGFQVWSTTLDNEVTDLLSVQDQIAGDIVGQVRHLMTADEDGEGEDATLATPPSELLAKGREQLQARSPRSIRRAIDSFNLALTGEPSYGEAYAGLAEAYLLLARGGETYGAMALSEALARARPYADKAMMLAPESAYVQAVAGLVALTEGQLEQAVASLEGAVQTDPQLSEAHLWLYMAHLAAGRAQDGYASLERAYEIDPDALAIGLNMSRLMVARKQLRDADMLVSRLEQLYPDNLNITLARAALLADMWQPTEAIKVLRVAQTIDPTHPAVRLMLGLTLLDIGDIQQATRLLDGYGQWADLVEGDLAGALEAARTDYARHPGSEEALYTLADVEAVAGHDQTVVDLLGPFDNGGRPIGPLYARAPLLLPAVTLALARRGVGDTAGATALLEAAQDYLTQQRALGLDPPQFQYLEARILAVKGETNQAMNKLRHAVLHRFPGVAVVKWDPALASLRGLPDYQSLVADLEAEQAQQRQRSVSLPSTVMDSPRSRDRVDTGRH